MSFNVTFAVVSDKMHCLVPLHLQSFLYSVSVCVCVSVYVLLLIEICVFDLSAFVLFVQQLSLTVKTSFKI